MEALVRTLIDWFALPEHGLSSVFVIAFVSATLLPMGSEPAVFGYAKINPDQFWTVVMVASAGNTLGGIVDYWMGYGAHEAIAHGKHTKYLRWFERMGPKTLIFAWLPAVGDPLCAVAGWLELPFWQSVFWMAIGKFLRYTFMTWALLSVPNAWWMAIIKPLAG